MDYMLESFTLVRKDGAVEFHGFNVVIHVLFELLWRLVLHNSEKVLKLSLLAGVLLSGL